MRLKRLVYTILIIVLAGSAISGVADNVSQTYAEQALKRALATFAAARALNGVISVAQGTEIALEPGGVGVMLTPGQVLDPINDLVERFSSVMLVASSSLGIQIILLEILSWWVVTALLVLTLAIWLASLWSPGLANKKFAGLTIRMAMILAVIRFAVPVVIICTNFFFDTFLLSKHETASNELTSSTMSIEELNTQIDGNPRPDEQPSSEDASEPPSDDSSFQLPDFGALASGLRSSAAELYADVSDWVGSMSISATIEQLEESAAEASSHIINLIVIFVLQTIILPLGILWLFVELLKALAVRSLSFVSGQRSPQVE